MSKVLNGVKAIAGNVRQSASRAAEQALEKGKDALDNVACEKRLKELERELGRAYYRLKKEGTGSERELEKYIRQINFYKNELEQQDDLDFFEHDDGNVNVHFCGDCGAEVGKDATFCGGCGQHFS